MLLPREDSSVYEAKRDYFKSDMSKFKKVKRDPTDALKKSLYGFIDGIKLRTNKFFFLFLPRLGCHHWGARPPLRRG